MKTPDKPLAERMRPRKLEDVTGQEHLAAKGNVFYKMVESGHLPSIILCGPPGVGKTTIAQILSQNAGLPFFTLSAVSSGVKDVRAVIEQARKAGKAVLFIDEIHRFSKSQQDSLLGAVEQGIITLIGATTENPSFEVIAPLLSRCQVYVLNPLTEDHLQGLLRKAMTEDDWLKQRNIELKETNALIGFSGGDARRLLNAFELVVAAGKGEKVILTDGVVQEFVQKRMARYDKTGEQHYDIISAFIKSVRGSDPNAALYWLARMVEGGEDPKFIGRRLIILASEDIGNANPTGLVMANACFEAVEKTGYPECTLILAQVTVYLASSPKSNSSYMAIKKALSLVKKTGDIVVPLHLRNAPTKLMKDMGYAEDYRYSHGFSGNFIDQEYFPDELTNTKLYDPGENSREREMRLFLKRLWGGRYGY